MVDNTADKLPHKKILRIDYWEDSEGINYIIFPTLDIDVLNGEAGGFKKERPRNALEWAILILIKESISA